MLIPDADVLACDLPKLAVNVDFSVEGENLPCWNGEESKIIDAFIEKNAIERNWTMEGFIEDQVAALRKQILTSDKISLGNGTHRICYLLLVELHTTALHHLAALTL